VCRHVRVSIRVPGNDTKETARLAHELWHAVEVAGAPDVRDQASVQRFYDRIGDGGRYSSVVETAKAEEIWVEMQNGGEAQEAPEHVAGIGSTHVRGVDRRARTPDGASDRPGTLAFITATPNVRFLRILVRAEGRPDDEMGRMAGARASARCRDR
jgi:hypothetical protein